MTFCAWLGSVFGDQPVVESEFELLFVANCQMERLITSADSFDSDQCKMAMIRNRYNQELHPRCNWESDNVIIRHHKREPRSSVSQQVITGHQQTDVQENITK